MEADCRPYRHDCCNYQHQPLLVLSSESLSYIPLSSLTRTGLYHSCACPLSNQSDTDVRNNPRANLSPSGKLVHPYMGKRGSPRSQCSITGTHGRTDIWIWRRGWHLTMMSGACPLFSIHKHAGKNGSVDGIMRMT